MDEDAGHIVASVLANRFSPRILALGLALSVFQENGTNLLAEIAFQETETMERKSAIVSAEISSMSSGEN